MCNQDTACGNQGAEFCQPVTFSPPGGKHGADAPIQAAMRADALLDKGD